MVRQGSPQVDQPRETLRFGGAIVFLASFVLMTLELVAGRVMAPYLGVSIFTWTAIIGVILAGISIGSWLGGKVADTDPKRAHLAVLFFAAGIATILMLFIVPVLGNVLAFAPLPLMVAALVFSTFTFLPTSILLGAVSPLVVKFDLTDLARTGRTVGRISALSTLGSILGTFATGFVLIDLIGTATIVRLSAVALLLLAAWVHAQGVRADKKSAAAGLLFISSLFLPAQCTAESQYYCIRVTDQQEFSVLRLDHLVHSYVSKTNPAELGYEYEKVYAVLLAAVGKSVPRALYVGGGGYTMPRYVAAEYPGSENTVLEIDPGVTKIVHERFGLPRDTSIVTINQDARIAMARMPANETYDFIFGDAFNDYSVPYHLTTREFHTLVKQHLAPDGWYAVNIIDDARHGRFLASTVATLRAQFKTVLVLPLGNNWHDKGRNTFVVLASNAELPTAWRGSAPKNVRTDGEHAADLWERIHFIVSTDDLDRFVAEKKGLVLTDDYVPVDTMLAPVFMDAF
ncbi:MAG: fused MFS/spermidine synthase [Patescibacteria group bacterium]